MPLDIAATLTPDDLQAANNAALHEYLANLNAVAKKMPATHLAWALRHAQMNAVVSELERRECIALLHN